MFAISLLVLFKYTKPFKVQVKGSAGVSDDGCFVTT